MNPLLDKEFLLELDNTKNKIFYVKIISLDLDENPIEEIQGKVQSGSINIDGSSAVRRSCSLSILANELNITDYYWGFKTKFKCYIGILNLVSSKYDSVIYFPMGTYLITSFNTSQNGTSYSVSISGKDKMCQLNGDIGGTITALSVDFGQMSVQLMDGSLKKEKLLLKDIIREAVHEYAQEPYHNIVINDLDDLAVELLEYRGDTPMYLEIDSQTEEVSNMTLYGDKKYYYKNGSSYSSIQVQNFDDTQLDHRINLDFGYESLDALRVYPSISEAQNHPEHYYTVCKAEYGDVIGYRATDLTYAGDLICNIGESITSMLDKIKTMLGDYEYFYNLDGLFVWQRVPTFINVSWNNLTQTDDGEVYGESAAYSSAISYSFENHNLVTAFQNNPDILNVKNDFSVFGARKGTNGAKDIPVHLRYAVDKKPTYYKSYDGIIYSTEPITKLVLELMALEAANNNMLNTLNNFLRSPLPAGLSDDWWDVKEWGEYYKAITGEYPSGRMNDYKTETTHIDLLSIFKVGRPQGFTGSFSFGTWNASRDCYIFDTITINDEIYLGYTGHNPTCTHYYHNYFMNYYDTYAALGLDFHAYFYKPAIPMDINLSVQLLNYIEMLEKMNLVVDWREIIYRMASDYMKHGMTDSNNYELVTTSLNQAEINKGIYYTKKNSYARATEYQKGQTYYRYSPSTNQYIQQTLSANTNFLEDNYYYIVEGDEFKLATTYNSSEKYYTYVDFLYRLRTYNADYYPFGKTGYELYYTDMMSFWRQLYDPEYVGTFSPASVNKLSYYKEGSKYYWFKNLQTEEYKANTIYYTLNLDGDWKAHKNVTLSDFYNYSKYYFLPILGKDSVSAESEGNLSDDEIFYSTRTYYKFDNDDYYLPDENYSYNADLKQSALTIIKNLITSLNSSYLNLRENVEKNDSLTLAEKRNKISMLDASRNNRTSKLKEKQKEIELGGDYSDILNATNYESIIAAKTKPYYWRKDIWEHPEKLIFWIDFLDTDGELGQYSISRIGDRPKTENNTEIRAIYYREIPNVIFVKNNEEKEQIKKLKPGYTIISVDNEIDNLFHISTSHLSCKDKLNELLNKHTCCKEQITITAIPVYYLQPNTRINVTDKKTGIEGEYIISRISYSLSYNGTMSITATKAVDRIY